MGCNFEALLLGSERVSMLLGNIGFPNVEDGRLDKIMKIHALETASYRGED